MPAAVEAPAPRKTITWIFLGT